MWEMSYAKVGLAKIKNAHMRERASAILIRDEKILLLRRENERGIYYVFVGGGIDPGENAEQAIVRELMEEAGISIIADKVLFVSENDFDHNTLVLCRQIDDKEPIWQELDQQTSTNSYVFEWVPLAELESYKLLPEEGKQFVLENRHSWPTN